MYNEREENYKFCLQLIQNIWRCRNILALFENFVFESKHKLFMEV